MDRTGMKRSLLPFTLALAVLYFIRKPFSTLFYSHFSSCHGWNIIAGETKDNRQFNGLLTLCP